MRVKLATFLLIAGTVAGCASTPPPPPPMAMAPEPAPAPAPAPAMSGPVEGVYRGTAALQSGSARHCRKLAARQTARVHNNMITLGAMRGRIGPDGTVSAVGGRGMSMSGNVSNGAADITTKNRGCSYHYTLNHI